MKDLLFLSNYQKSQKTHFQRKIVLAIVALSMIIGNGIYCFVFNKLIITGIFSEIILIVVSVFGIGAYQYLYQISKQTQLVSESIEKKEGKWKLHMDKGLTFDDLKQGHLVSEPEEIMSTHQLIGMINGNGIFDSNLQLFKKKYQLGKREQLCIFSGRYMIIQSKVNFKGIHILIGKNQFNQDENNFLKRVTSSDLNRKIVDQYHVYSDNEEELAQIFNDKMIHWLIECENHYKCELRISFKRNTVHIGFNEMKMQKVSNINERDYRHMEFDMDMIKLFVQNIENSNQVTKIKKDMA